MTILEKMKSGELYDCSFEAIGEDLDRKLYEKERKRNTIVNTETGSMAYFIKMMDIRHQ